MIWLTWRQHRRQALFAALGLAALAALLIPTGISMRNAFTDSGLARCLREVGKAEFLTGSTDCDSLAGVFTTRYESATTLSMLLVFLPLLAGLFWGAPLVARELEHGTHRLVWTQGVSRMRWAGVKLGLIIAATAVVSAGYALLVSWWLAPLNDAGRGRLSELSFDVQGIVPVAYALFAVALGVFAGTVWRRVLPAMAAALAGFLALRFVVLQQVRGHVLPALERTYPVIGGQRPNPSLGDWTFSVGIKNAAGEVISSGQQTQCSPSVAGQPGGPCASIDPGAYNFQLYQPAGNFWPLQFIEAGLFTALAALLLFLAIWRIRSRLA
ncbi:ABC transporter permease [Planotetraspora phitsanulokensis]|uniref:Transporter n=1 Tax=Planotetraspora phitsanulokensis TaxID=575192 RepID=A0A8J3U199_9ACTN|nr:ABC transporter permease subunit [Planotetraspora phitsanulokensis]GII36489.1 transporter [Planotetraspora phitsanulokensis]